MNKKEKGKDIKYWFLKMPYNFLLFFIVQVLVVVLFPLQIYEAYVDISPYLSIFYFLLIIFLPEIIIYYLFLNAKHLKKIIYNDYFLLLFFILVLVTGIFLLIHIPVVSRLDKGMSALSVIAEPVDIGLIADFGGIFKAKAYFLFFNFLDSFFQINFKVLANINTVFVMLEAIAVYFIIKLLTKDINTLIWSFGILLFSVFLRVGSEIWFFIYFVIFYLESRNSKNDFINNKINLFLLLSLPCIFPVFLLYASSSFIGSDNAGNFTDPEMATQIVNNGNNVMGLLKYHFLILSKNFFYNFYFLKTHVPLFWIILFIPVLAMKNKRTWIYFLYFLIFFFVITTFHYDQRLDAFNYLAYLFIPLIILYGFFLRRIRNIPVMVLLTTLIIIANNFFYYSYSLPGVDEGTLFWNSEYEQALISLDKIKPNSIILANSRYSIVPAIYGFSDDYKIEQIEKEFISQMPHIKKKYSNIYIEQTAIDCVRNTTTFNREEFYNLVRLNFDYNILLDIEKKMHDGGRCNMFLYELKN